MSRRPRTESERREKLAHRPPGSTNAAKNRDARQPRARDTTSRVTDTRDANGRVTNRRPNASRPSRSARGSSRRPRPARLAPRKRFGQHFLERAWVEKLVRDIAPSAGDTFIEIGPGRGALTLPLAESGARIRAIEIDRDLAADLAARVPENVTVIAVDFLALSPDALLALEADAAEAPLAERNRAVEPPAEGDHVPARDSREAGATRAVGAARGDALAPRAQDRQPAPGARMRVVGNVPYNLSSPILFRLLALARETGRLVDATLMLQREVAVRVAAGPGTGDYGPLSILTALHADVERRFDLPPGAFRPPPKVHSAVIRLRFRPPTVDVGDYARFERLVRTIFQQRRKTLSNALTGFLHAPAASLLARAGIDGRRRPETLTLSELAHLKRLLTAPPAV